MQPCPKPSTRVGFVRLTVPLRAVHTGHPPTLPRRRMSVSPMIETSLRHDWTRADVLALLSMPFNDLVARAQAVHRANHDANAVQVSTLLSIKTGGCPEDC